MARDNDDSIAVQKTLLRLARPSMSPKELLKETMKAHPKLSKKDVVRAAFSSIIAIADTDVEKALALQDFALQQRGGGD